MTTAMRSCCLLLSVLSVLSGCGLLSELSELSELDAPETSPWDSGAPVRGTEPRIDFRASGAGARNVGTFADYPFCRLDPQGAFEIHNAATAAPQITLTVGRFDVHRTTPFDDVIGSFIDEPGHFYDSKTPCRLMLGEGASSAKLSGDFSCGDLRDAAGNKVEISSGHFVCCLECP